MLLSEVMGMEKYRVTLTEEEQSYLLGIVNTGKSNANRIKHANILLAIDENAPVKLNLTDSQVAQVYHAGERTISTIRKAFVLQGLDIALERKKRAMATNVKIDGEIEAKIVALTCQNPPEGHSRWTLRLLASQIVALGIIDDISHVTVGDTLKKTRLSHGYTKNGVSPKLLRNM